METSSMFEFASNLGVIGVLLYMYMTERKERQEIANDTKALKSIIEDARADRDTMVKVVQEHTKAVTTLSERIEAWNTRPCLIAEAHRAENNGELRHEKNTRR